MPLNSNFFYISSSVLNLRERPNVNSHVVSQALFLEPVLLKKKEGTWNYISTSDGYEGWVDEPIHSQKNPYLPNVETCNRACPLYALPHVEYGPIKMLPFGIKLQILEQKDERWSLTLLPDQTTAYIQNGHIAPIQQLEKKDLLSLSKQFLGVPYLWGGRSSFGYDCSSFVQMLYGKMGKSLPRDAKDQIKSPFLQPISFQHLEATDLIFFGKSKQHIGHVGMYLENGHFIHASLRENKPWVRISHLEDLEWSGIDLSYYPFRAAYRLCLDNVRG